MQKRTPCVQLAVAVQASFATMSLWLGSNSPAQAYREAVDPIRPKFSLVETINRYESTFGKPRFARINDLLDEVFKGETELDALYDEFCLEDPKSITAAAAKLPSAEAALVAKLETLAAELRLDADKINVQKTAKHLKPKQTSTAYGDGTSSSLNDTVDESAQFKTELESLVLRLNNRRIWLSGVPNRAPMIARLANFHLLSGFELRDRLVEVAFWQEFILACQPPLNMYKLNKGFGEHLKKKVADLKDRFKSLSEIADLTPELQADFAAVLNDCGRIESDSAMLVNHSQGSTK